MPTVFIPASLRQLADDHDRVELDAANVRDAIDELEQRFPGIAERLVPDGALRPGLAIAVDGNISSLGLLQKLGPESELHFLPAVGGG